MKTEEKREKKTDEKDDKDDDNGEDEAMLSPASKEVAALTRADTSKDSSLLSYLVMLDVIALRHSSTCP